jgi:hypothetical protein
MNRLTTIAFLAMVAWWITYITRDHAALELVAALGNTLAWALLLVRSIGERRVEAIVQDAVGDKGKRR